MESKKFSTREWVFVSIILFIVQAGIWYAAFENSDSGSALNYVSFAGTLVSIILAVLAIGYTYSESQAQKNKSDTVANQIGALNEVIKNIQFESKSLENISDISLQLSKFANNFDDKMVGTTKDVHDVKKHLIDLNESLSRSINDKVAEEKQNHKQLFETFKRLSERTVMLGLVMFNGDYDKTSKFFDAYLLDNEKKFGKNVEFHMGLIYGICTTMMGTLSQLNIWKTDEKAFEKSYVSELDNFCISMDNYIFEDEAFDQLLRYTIDKYKEAKGI